MISVHNFSTKKSLFSFDVKVIKSKTCDFQKLASFLMIETENDHKNTLNTEAKRNFAIDSDLSVEIKYKF